MTADEIKTRFPNANRAFIEANLDAESHRKTTKLERPAVNESLETDQVKKTTAGKLHIRFVSVRKRLLDPDNISAKWLLDCLRYCRIIPGDEPDKISIETTQRKALKGETEHTLIEIS